MKTTANITRTTPAAGLIFRLGLMLLLCFAANTSIAVQYYNKPNSNLDVATNWGTNTNGTGTTPPSGDFTTDTFNLNNNPGTQTGGSWRIGSKSNPGVATLYVNYTGTILLNNDLEAVGKSASITTIIIGTGATLDMGNHSFYETTVGTTAFTNLYASTGVIRTAYTGSGDAVPLGVTWSGTIEYYASGNQQVSNGIYATLKLSGSGTKAMTQTIKGTTYFVTVNDTLIMQGGTASAAPTYGSAAAIKYNTTMTTGVEWTSTFTCTGGIIAGSGTATIPSSTPKTLAAGVPLTLLSGATLANNGNNISLGGDILGTGTESGTGTITMITSGASISGATISNLTLNNAGGFSLSGSATITGTLTLTAGNLTLGTNDLTLGASSTVTGATTAKYLLTSGTGTVRKVYTANGSYKFEVGSNVYSPITLNVAGTYGTGAFVSVNVQNAKEPHNANATNYLNRYWSVSSSGVTSLSYTVTSASYVTGDVTGTEANMVLGVYPGSLPWKKPTVSSVNTSTHVLSSTGAITTSGNITGINNAPPTVSSSFSAAAICFGASGTLTATAVGDPTLSYSWTPSTGLSGTTTASVTASPTVTTTYSVTVTDGNGFTAISGNTVVVNPLPAAIAGLTGVCGTASSTLSDATTGGTWSSSSSTTATVGTSSGIVTGVSTGTTTITYTLTYATGACTTKATTTFSVNAVPSATPSNNSPICSGSAATLSANPGANTNVFVWTGPSFTSSLQNPTVIPASTSTYTLVAGNNSGLPGCSPTTKYTTTVTVTSSGVWLGGTSTNWATGTNWCGGVPTASTDVIIPSGTTFSPSITAGTENTKNITIQSSAALTVNGGALNITGTISNSGTFTATNGTIIIGGSSALTIPANTFASNTIKNLTINNSSTAGVTLGGTLNVSDTVKATSGKLNSAGYLTLLSVHAKTALIDGSGAGDVLGDVTMQRYFDSSYGYKIIASPFQAATINQMFSFINMLDTFPQFYKHVENVASTGWVTDTTGSDTLKPMNGYGSNFGSSFSSKTISLHGTVNNGSISNTIYNHNQTYTGGFNCIGNPYPSPIDWNASTGWTKTNVDNAIYFYDNSDTNRYYGTYSSYIGGVSSNGRANNIIPSMQGFFVHVTNGSFPVTGTLDINNNARVGNLSPAYHKTTRQNMPLVRMYAGFEKNRKADPLVIYFKDKSSKQFDNQFDAIKPMNTDEQVPNVYSISEDAYKMSIYALPDNADSMYIVPVGLDIQQNGMIDFDGSDIENIPAGMQVYFVDLNAGVTQDMGNRPHYMVNLNKGTYENRFLLCFKPQNAPAAIFSGDMFSAYGAGSKVHVNLNILSGGSGTITITDMSGRIVNREKVNGYGGHEIQASNVTGVYIVSLASNGKIESKKIFVNGK